MVEEASEMIEKLRGNDIEEVREEIESREVDEGVAQMIEDRVQNGAEVVEL
jgi:hypothetical protein